MTADKVYLDVTALFADVGGADIDGYPDPAQKIASPGRAAGENQRMLVILGREVGGRVGARARPLGFGSTLGHDSRLTEVHLPCPPLPDRLVSSRK